MKTLAITLLTLAFATTSFAANLFATYEVPVKDQPELANANIFRMRNVTLEKAGEMTFLKYSLPLELTGKLNVIEFKGQLDKSGNGKLDYEQNQMDCQEDKISLTCNVAFKGLNIDQNFAANIIAKNFPKSQRDLRVQIQKKFSTDPVGIIRIYKRRR